MHTNEQTYALLCPMQHPAAQCVGEKCAMWRRAPEPARKHVVCEYRMATNEPTRPSDIPHSWIFVPVEEAGDFAHWLEPDADLASRRVGWCGLAGRKGA